MLYSIIVVVMELFKITQNEYGMVKQQKKFIENNNTLRLSLERKKIVCGEKYLLQIFHWETDFSLGNRFYNVFLIFCVKNVIFKKNLFTLVLFVTEGIVKHLFYYIQRH